MLKLLPLGTALATIVSIPTIFSSPVNALAQRTNSSELFALTPAVTSTKAQNITLATTMREPNYQTPRGEESAEAGTLVVLSVIVGTIAVAVASAKKANKPTTANFQAKPGKVLIDQASPKLRQKLLRLLHNDHQAANRLLTHVILNHPNQSVNWAMEKAIYDLERDRGRY